MVRDSESPLSLLSLPSCRQKEEATVSAVSWPPPTHQQKRPQEETYLAGTLISTSSPKTVVLAGSQGRLTGSNKAAVSVSTWGLMAPRSRGLMVRREMDTTQQVLRGTDVLRVQAANGPWRGSVSCTNLAPSLQPSKAQAPLHHGPRAPSAQVAVGCHTKPPACPLLSRMSRECQPFIHTRRSFSTTSLPSCAWAPPPFNSQASGISLFHLKMMTAAPLQSIESPNEFSRGSGFSVQVVMRQE